MKTKYLAAALAALLTTTLAAVAQGTTAFTYQGRLNVSGTPANGLFDLRFELFDVPAGGASRISPFVANSVPVSNGLFVAQIDFGQFGGQAYWIEIAARPGGSAASFNILSPRQRLTPTPYASFAAGAGAYEGPIGDYQLSPNVAMWGSDRSFPPVNFVAPTRPDRPPFTVNNSLLIANLNADKLDGFDASDFWKLNGNADTVPGVHYVGTSDNQPLELRANFQLGLRLEPGASAANLSAPGNLSFGAQTRQMLNLFNADYGIGVQAGTHYFRTAGNSLFTPSGNFAWFAGGQHSDATFDPGPPSPTGSFFETPREMMRLDGNGQLTVFGQAGNGVQGNSRSAGASGVYGENAGGGFGVAGRTTGGGSAIYGDNADPSGWAGNFNGRVSVSGNLSVSGNVSVSGNQSFGAQTRQMLNLYNADYGIGIQSSTLYFRSQAGGIGVPESGFSWYLGGSHQDNPLNVNNGIVAMRLRSSSLEVKGSVITPLLIETSDRNAKKNFRPVNSREVLDKVASLSVSRWRFTNDLGGEHIGPMAQDFFAAFGVGPDDKHIATVDADGVALAAIQGLNQKVEERANHLEKELKRRDAENAELKARLTALERLIINLNPKGN